MSVLELPERLPLTAADFEHLPAVEGLRIELWEGNLDVAAAAQMAWHSIMMRRVANLLESDGRVVTCETGVVLGRRTVREPDVSRFRHGVVVDLRRSQFPAADIDLVVEIISPESQKRDRLIKPDEYANAGIAELWLVDEHPQSPEDGLVDSYRLTPRGGYGLARTVALSLLENESRRHTTP